MAAEPQSSEATPETELPKMTFLDHLEELRKRLMVSMASALFMSIRVRSHFVDVAEV